MRTARSFALLVALAAGSTPNGSHAAELHNVLVDYTLTTWGQKDGLASTTIRALAQDADGYLWLGTEAGLLRFDGARFTRWQPAGGGLPQAPVRALLVADDGSMWSGFGERGGVSRYKDGVLRNYGPADGLTEGAVTAIIETRDHTIWVGGSGGLFRVDRDRWLPASTLGISAAVNHASLDRDGRLLVATANRVYRQTAAGDRFEPLEPAVDGLRAVAADAAGDIWVTDSMSGFRRLGDLQPHTAERGRGARLLHDSDGNLWVGTTTKGLWRARIARGATTFDIEKANALTGFSDDGVTSLFEDADGNIWAGTLDGLNRLTPHRITPVTDLGLVNAVEAGTNDTVWIGSADSVTRFGAGDPSDRPADAGRHIEAGRNMETSRQTFALSSPLSAMHVDERGTVWIAMGGTLERIDNGRRTRVPIRGVRLRRISSLTTDRRGGLWITEGPRKLLHWSYAGTDIVQLPDALSGDIVASEVDRSGRLWLTSSHGQVALLSADGSARTYSAHDGLTAGVYRTITEDTRGVIWLAGTEGLSRFANGSFSTLSSRDTFPAAALTTIIDDAAGSLWLGVEASHIIRVERDELEQAFERSNHPIHYRVFDKFDGVAGTPRWFGNRAGVRAAGGRLWFVAGRGMAIIDPENLPVGRAKPVQVRVERIVADERDVTAPVHLQPRTLRLGIDYTVIDLTSPLRTRFRYMLDGFDAGWIDAGAQRRAFYTNLPPGSYQFKVMATNADGTWSEPTVLPITMPPMFYQRTWFLLACIAAVAITTAAAWRLHVRRVRHEFALLVAERARVGREIHDTLLQGLFGLALRCDSLAAAHGDADPALKAQFLQMRRELQDYIAEARGSIRDLRSPRKVDRDLPEALRQVAEKVTAGSAIECEVVVAGTPRRSTSDVDQQVLRIAQEAVSNAVRHGDASTVSLELHYGPQAITLRVRDDGRGFQPEAVATTTGHYGLVLMRERAESVGGTLTVTAAVSQGATIEAVVPA